MMRPSERRAYDRERREARKWAKLSDLIDHEMNVEVAKHMARGLDYDAAWIAAGGSIIPLEITEHGDRG